MSEFLADLVDSFLDAMCDPRIAFYVYVIGGMLVFAPILAIATA